MVRFCPNLVQTVTWEKQQTALNPHQIYQLRPQIKRPLQNYQSSAIHAVAV
jgi:hypothetical protein